MANISAYLAKAMLDWVLGGATPTQPASRLAALSLGTPTSVSASEHSPLNLGYARQTSLFSAAASPAGSASNTAAMTFGPFSSSTAIQGLVVFDTTAFTAGNMLWYGTLLTARTVLPGDTLVVAAGALIITLS
jgi:hypothetical protein